nr:E3 ubiquitin-protein ligase synoviolin-like [Dasypus novemcinctus]
MVPPTSKAKHYPVLPPAEAVRTGKRLCPHVPRTQRALRTGFGWRAEEDLKGLPEGKLPSVKHRTVLPPPPLPKPVWEGAAPGPEPPPGGFCPGEVELSGASPTLALPRLPASRVGPEAAPQARSQTAASRGSRSAATERPSAGRVTRAASGRVYQQVFPAAGGSTSRSSPLRQALAPGPAFLLVSRLPLPPQRLLLWCPFLLLPSPPHTQIPLALRAFLEGKPIK